MAGRNNELDIYTQLKPTDMKTFFKRILVISFLLTLSYAASAQWYVGGSIGGSYSNSKSTSTTAWAVSISPEAGYIFNERWAVGGLISYGKAVTKVYSQYLDKTDVDITLLSINPYAIYAPIRFKNFAVCAEMGVMFAPPQPGVNFATFGAYITPLLTYSINEHISLKTELDFAGLSVSGTTNGTFSFGASVGGDDAIMIGDDLSIGFIYKF